MTIACNSSSTTRRSVANKRRRIGAGEQQGELFGRGEQDVGRLAALALAFARRRVAGAGLDADGKSHFGDGNFEIARHVDGERLQRRDIERVQRRAAQRPSLAELDQRRQEAGKRLAGAGRRDQQSALARLGAGEKGELMGARLPAARGKPAGEGCGKLCERIGHAAKLSKRSCQR